MSLEKLNEKSKEFVFSEFEGYKDEERLKFIAKFPIDSIKTLTIDQYATGTDKNSFCYWLEFKKILFGIGGGNASKFGLYRAKDGKFYTGSRKSKKQLEGAELDDFLEKIKSGILLALSYTEKDEIEKIKDIDIPLWNMVLQKILAIYYPEKFITIGASDVLIECARDIKIQNIELSPDNSIQINYECKKFLSSLPEYKDWPNEKIGTFIWETYNAQAKRNYYILGSKYGENADRDIFPEMLKNSVIATGFASHINLKEYYLKNQSEIIEYLKEQGESSNSYSALKYFLRLKAGDYVAIKADGSPKGSKGFLSIVGIAEVIEKDGEIYGYDPDGLGHLVNVKFIKSPVYKEFKLGGYGRTIHKLSKPDHIDLIFKSEYDLLSPELAISPKKPTDINLPLNTILYGPPGTGKTYKLKNEFFQKFTDESSIQTEEEFLQELVDNLSWWEVIAAVLYDLQKAGVSQIIKHPLLKAKAALSANKNIRSTIWGTLQAHTIENCKYVKYTNRQSPLIFNKSEDSSWEIINQALEEEAPEVIELISKSKKFKPQIVKKKRYVFTTFHQSFSYEDFIEGIKPIIYEDEEAPEKGKQVIYDIKAGLFKEIAKEADNDRGNDYAIFIDEINRGNIANIFGELITLIEEDKRIDSDNYIAAKLPYSGEDFGIPPNLYIIGTMNTADRSVEALDTALRRRFSFIEMNPDAEKLGEPEFRCEGIDLEKLLNAINGRIEKLLDKDYCIGHSYFMSIKNRQEPLLEIKAIFKNKILPLLQEYFYGDWGKIILVIGKEFIKKKVETIKFLSNGLNDEYEQYEEKPVYYFTDSENWTIESFKSIYE